MQKIALVACLLCLFSFAIRAGAEESRRPKIGLVLSGGGAKGIAHVGVLKVLEEAGIEVDYIAGTSMGSIVGGLYASGYRAEMLERLVLTMDWDEVLADEVSRRSVSIDEKEDHQKFIGSFAISRAKIHLPRGYKRGQRLTGILSRLTLHVQHIKDFRKLPIPFLCIGTDIVTGDAVVLDKGYLPDALRASMAIPTIFTPIEINGTLLVDGGVVRNLPVTDMIEMGADYIIAVDVGAPLYKKEELNSIAEIMDQSVSFLGAASTKFQRTKANLLITPDIKGFSGGDFKKGKALILNGEKAAREVMPKLKAIAEEQKKYKRDDKRGDDIELDIKRIFIKEIRIEGLQHVSKNLVLGKLMIVPPSVVKPDKIMEAVDRLYASGFFERVTYELEPSWDYGYCLVLRVVESAQTFLKIGFSYDTDVNAALLLNVTLKNLAGQGSKVSFDARLSQNPGVRASYFLHSGWRRPGIGFGVAGFYDKYAITTDKNGELVSYYNYQNMGGDIFVQTILFNSVAIGVGALKDYTLLKSQITTEAPEKQNSDSLNYYGFLMYDNLDRTFFPRSGIKLYGEARYVTDHLSAPDTKGFYPFMKYLAKMQCMIPLHKRVSFGIGGATGSVQGKEPYYLSYNQYLNLGIYRRRIPFLYLNYLGGMNTYDRDYFPFMGLTFMQINGKNVLIMNAKLQIEPLVDKYIVLSGNVARVKDRYTNLFRKKNRKSEFPFTHEHLRNDLLYGYGLTLGINTIIGPVELTLMRGSESNRFMVYFNLGFRL